MAVSEEKTGLAPVVATTARLLILGSLPGEASLAARAYYAHPTNHFWRLLGAVIDEDLSLLSYDDRLGRLEPRGIGLWDVIGSAQRKGSLDQAIRGSRVNALAEFVDSLPELRAVAFNGRTAARLGAGMLADRADRLALVELPSSSAANTMAFAEKARRWSVLGDYCR